MFKRLLVPKEPAATITRCIDEMKAKQRANTAAWGHGSTDRWDADLDMGMIWFSNTGGLVVSAPLQIVGSYDSIEGTWLWSWDNPCIPEPLTHAARLARAFGEKWNLAAYTERLVACPEGHGWDFTAVALHLSGGAGSYRGPAGSTYVFMTFGDVKIEQSH